MLVSVKPSQGQMGGFDVRVRNCDCKTKSQNEQVYGNSPLVVVVGLGLLHYQRGQAQDHSQEEPEQGAVKVLTVG